MVTGLDKATLMAIATTAPQLSVRRCAAHALFSLGVIKGCLDTAHHAEVERARELAASAQVAEAIAKAQGVKP